MQAVIIAGGLATRLRPLTEKIPKVLLELAGRPFLDHQLEWLARRGVTKVVLCLGHLAEQVQAFAGDGTRWGLELRYSLDGPTQLGTAGAVRLACDRGLLDERFLVTWGDSFLPIDPRGVFERFVRSGLPALMTVYENQGRLDASNAELDGLYARYDKKQGGALGYRAIDYGLLAFERRIFEERVPQGVPFDLAAVCHALSRRAELAGDEAYLRFFEIGSHQGLAEAQAFFEAGGPPKGLVVLDRDGVLDAMIPLPGGAEDSPQSLDQISMLPGAALAVRMLHDAGYTLAIATNQPAAAKGKTPRATLEAVHAKVLDETQALGGRIASSHICWHRHEDGCDCRKPKPGLPLEALARWPNVDRADAWMIGDRATDVAAAQGAGLRTAKLGADAGAEWTGPSLEAFARWLLGRKGLVEPRSPSPSVS